MLLIGLDIACHGVLLARRSYAYIASAYSATLLALVGFTAACKALDWGLTGVWWAIVLFFALRTVFSGAAVARAYPKLGAELATGGSGAVKG